MGVMKILNCSASFLFGIVCWTLGEYLLHRFLGHRFWRRGRFALEHGRHHSERNFFASAALKIRVAGSVILLMGPIASWIVGLEAGLAFTLGFTLSYIGYEALHRHFHINPPQTRWGSYLRRHHFAHHFVNARKNHSVTFPFWDWVFGTDLRVPKDKPIKVPANLAMDWLLHPEPKALGTSSDYQTDYQLVLDRTKKPNLHKTDIQTN